jgi:hypothetical protein
VATPAAQASTANLMRSLDSDAGTASRAGTIQTMQRAVGNARLSRMLGAPMQPKLAVGAPDDSYEQEADRVADTVMRMADAPVSDEHLTGLQGQQRHPRADLHQLVGQRTRVSAAR